MAHSGRVLDATSETVLQIGIHPHQRTNQLLQTQENALRRKQNYIFPFSIQSNLNRRCPWPRLSIREPLQLPADV